MHIEIIMKKIHDEHGWEDDFFEPCMFLTFSEKWVSACIFLKACHIHSSDKLTVSMSWDVPWDVPWDTFSTLRYVLG